MSTAVDPNLNPVIVAGAGGGGASLPATPAAALLDVASPSTFVVLDPAGVGASITPADARSAISLPAITTGQVTLSAWTAGSATGGAAVAQQSTPSRIRFTVPASTAGAQSASRADLVPDPDAWDVAIRVQVIAGDGSAAPRIRLSVGVSSSNCAVLEIDTTGRVIAYRVSGGSPTDNTTLTGQITSGQLTGGQLWLRLRGTPAGYRSYFGVGSTGAVPTTWTAAQSRAGDGPAAVTYAGFVQILVGTIDTSVGAGLTVDVLDVRALGQSGAVL